MPPGRRPKPTLLHELHGTLNATRHKARAREPEAPGDPLTDPPAWLTESQKEGWRHAIAHAPRGLLRPIDRTVLVIWVEAEDRHRRAAIAQAALDADAPDQPLVQRGPAGILQESPYGRILARTAETLLRATAELGFSPAARPRLAGSIGPEATPAADPWQQLKLLNGGKG